MSSLSEGCTILIPAYNEEKIIGEVLAHIQQVMAATTRPYQLLVVDDGSTDNIAAAVQAIPTVELLRNATNRGYGGAIKAGIRHARYDLIVITDADGTYPNEEIPHLLTLMDNNDMVVGARTGENVHIPLVRRPAKWFINTIANYGAGSKIPDLNSGLRVFRKSIMLLFYPVLPNGFSLTTTITMAMLANRYTVEYVPINYHHRVGKSKIRPIYDTLNFTLLILRTTIYYAPLRVFMPLSILIFLAGLLVGLYTLFIIGRIMDITTIVLLLASLQVALTGLLADMVDKRTSRF